MSRNASALCLAVALAVSARATLARQDPQQPLFRSGTELVQVDAIVRDGDGNFVSGLAADDFEVLEDGKAQPIQLFYLVTGPSSVVPRAVVPDGTLRAPDQTARRVFALVFDQDHLDFEPFRKTQIAAIAFLEEHFRPGDVGGIVLEGGVANGRLTTIRRELLDIVRNARPHTEVRDRFSVFREWPRLESEFEAKRIDAGDDRALNDAMIRNCQERPQECARAGISEQVENDLQWNARRFLSEARVAASRFIDTISYVTTGLGRMEGRKTVVIFSEGFLVDETRGVLAQVAARAARYGVTIYAVDARGLARTSTRIADASDVSPRLRSWGFDSIEDGPNILTSETGGFVVRNRNDFTDALAEIAEDTSTYYVLGYSPANPTLDGKFRKIEVRVKWKGMDVRARKGYLATPLPPPARMRRAQTEIPMTAPASPPVPAAPPPAATAPADAVGSRSFDHLVTVMFPRPEPETRVRELRALDPKARAPAAGAAAPPASAAERGWERYQAGDVEAAQREFASAAAEPNAAAWTHYALGLAELALGHHGEAAAALERTRSIEPEFEPAYFDLADSYLQMEEPSKAADVLRSATRRWPRDTDTWNALGVAEVHCGDLDAAIAAFRKATEIDARDGLAFFNLGRAYEQRYVRSRRLEAGQRTTSASESDRSAARANYEKYLDLGGPFEAEARAALSALR
jgi:VWFA-related protein